MSKDREEREQREKNQRGSMLKKDDVAPSFRSSPFSPLTPKRFSRRGYAPLCSSQTLIYLVSRLNWKIKDEVEES